MEAFFTGKIDGVRLVLIWLLTVHHLSSAPSTTSGRGFAGKRRKNSLEQSELRGCTRCTRCIEVNLITFTKLSHNHGAPPAGRGYTVSASRLLAGAWQLTLLLARRLLAILLTMLYCNLFFISQFDRDTWLRVPSGRAR